MRKDFTFLIIFISFFSVLNLNVISQTTANNEDNLVKDVVLDKTKVFTWCPTSERLRNVICKKDDLRINISTIIASEKDDLTYYYLADGGRIIGEGKNVVWDLFGVKPGKFSITVGVGKDFIIKGNTVTKTIDLEACPQCDFPCICPNISVSAPTGIAKRGDTLIFSVETKGSGQDHIKFNWIVSAGTIIAGQGTKQILVKTNKNSSFKTITATLEVDGQECLECPREFSATAQFTVK